MKFKILKIAQKYINTCKIDFDVENNILIWKGFFKRYKAIYTRSELHQQLKLTYGNICMKISYIRLPDKLGIYKSSDLYKLPSFVSINSNLFKVIDIIHTSNEKELREIEDVVNKKLKGNKNINFEKFGEFRRNILKTVFLAYSLFTKFLAFIYENYRELYDIIMDFLPVINKEDIKQFLFDSEQFESIETLFLALEDAIKEENYERASKLKKQIEEIKKGQI